MLESREFPLILSPNLGCPEIVCADALKAKGTIRLIVAAPDGGLSQPLGRLLAGPLYLRLSYGTSPEIPLRVVGRPQEIVDWNLLSGFATVEATREMISNELHYHVLGGQTRYWKVEGSMAPAGKASPAGKGREVPTGLFDLVWKDKSSGREKVNYHAIQVVERIPTEARFIHLTDLHVAQRNDEIRDEVIASRSEMTRDCIKRRYVNFNDRFREFISRANDMAKDGQLDFVVITGDLVDYAFCGWDAGRDQSENNWKTFINIVTGGGKEKDREIPNEGIRVPIFTSTGNHDWRLYPYDPKVHCKIFGLDRRIIKGYKHKHFDSREYPESDQTRAARGLTRVARDAMTKMKAKVSWLSKNRLIPWIAHAVVLGGGGVGLVRKQWWLAGISLGVEALILLANKLIRRLTRWGADLVVSHPLLAEARALHYYLEHINPYFDYAFRYGHHSFIVMDSGSDVFTADLLDGKHSDTLKRMSLNDNILGGSPDSMAFDSRRKYYNWSQIVWLEKVLSTCNRQECDGRTFLFLHAPPLNPSRIPLFKRVELRESKRKAPYPAWIPECDCNLTFGTVNHHLRQFLNLCMGYCEGELSTEVIRPTVRKVDIVFCGHAHANIEFRVATQWSQQESEHAIRVYCDAYSQIPAATRDDQWWDTHTPLIVQTAACGPGGAGTKNQTGARGPGSSDRRGKPPYYRLVHIDDKGKIIDFSALYGKGEVVGWSEPILQEKLGDRAESVWKTCKRWFGCQWCPAQKRWMSRSCGEVQT